MAKLQIYVEGTLDEDEMQQTKKWCLTYYNVYIYWSRLLEEFEASRNTVRNDYRKTLARLSDGIRDRFENLTELGIDLKIFLPPKSSKISFKL